MKVRTCFDGISIQSHRHGQLVVRHRDQVGIGNVRRVVCRDVTDRVFLAKFRN